MGGGVMRTFLSCLILVSLVMSLPEAGADDRPALAGDRLLVQASGPTSLSDSCPDSINLDGLRDVGFAINLVRQQALNIFLEATRKSVSFDSSPDTLSPSKISSKNIDRSAKYLQPRVEWLVYYVGTMEPIIHLLKDDLKLMRAKEQKLLIPAGTEKKLEPLFDVWTGDVKELDAHLSRISDLIGKPDENVEIAQQSVAMFDVTNSLDTARKRAFKIIQSAGENPSMVDAPFGSEKRLK